MRWLIIASIWVVLTAWLLPEEGEPTFVFGVRIAMGSNSEMTSFIAMRYSPDGYLREKKMMRRDDFIRVLSGYWPSTFNPKRLDYFKLERVEGGVVVVDGTKSTYPQCQALDSLWKIRFSNFPYRGGSDEGWSQEMYKPSLKQEKYLADRYNIKHLDLDYIINDKFWQLLRDVMDREWVANYKSLQ